MKRTYLLVGLTAAAFAVGGFISSLPSASAEPSIGLQPTATSTTASTRATIKVSPSSAPPTATVTISGKLPFRGPQSCPAGNAIQFTSTSALFPPDGFGPTTMRAKDGNFSTPYRIPASTPPAAYSIGMRCGGGNVGIDATLTVTSTGPLKPSIRVSPTTAAPGERITISGDVPVRGPLACPSGDPAQLTSTTALFPNAGFGPQADRSATGAFRVHYVIPSSTAAGVYLIGARCGGGNIGIVAKLTVT